MPFRVHKFIEIAQGGIGQETGTAGLDMWVPDPPLLFAGGVTLNKVQTLSAQISHWYNKSTCFIRLLWG